MIAPRIGPDEVADAADVGHQQNDGRLLRAELLRVHDLEIDRREAAGDAGEEGGEAERDEADALRGIADVLRPLGVVAHRVADASEGRAGQRVHRGDADEAPDRDQPVDLDLRPELQPNSGASLARLVVIPSSPPKKLRRMNELDDTSSPMPSEIIEKTSPGAPRRHRAEQDAEGEAGQAADQRDDRHRHAELVVDDGVHRVDRDEAAEAVIDGVAERQEARLPEQHVVGEREDDHRCP